MKYEMKLCINLLNKMEKDQLITRVRTVAAISYLETGEYKCGICNKKVDMACKKGPNRPSVDHIIPKSKGGIDHLDNYQLAHEACNQRKGDKMPDWYIETEYLEPQEQLPVIEV